MFFNGKSKQLPYLSEYLAHVAQTSISGNMVVIDAGPLMPLIIGGIASIMVLKVAAAVSGPLLGAVMAILVAVGVLFGLYKKAKDRRRVKSPEEILQEKAAKVSTAMFHSVQRRRLHRELPTGVATLLEESARHWSRTMSALNTPFWTNENLPLHWRAVREQSLSAANSGMAELMLIAGSCFHPNPTKQGWEDVVEDVVGTVFSTPTRVVVDDRMPVGFEQAREIAEKLKLVASAVEKASHDVVRDEAVVGGYRSGAALDLALSELKSVQEAEQELRAST